MLILKQVQDDVQHLQRRRKCTKCGYRWTTVEIDIFTYEQKIKGDVEEDEYEE